MVSIGYCSSFSDDRDVLIRKSMAQDDGVDLVRMFIKRMITLQRKHFRSLPKTVHNALERFKVLLTDKSLSVEEKSKISQKFYYLENLTKLKIIGFNSDSYDLPCLFSYLIEVIGPTEVQVIKKGASFFSLNYQYLSFRDVMNYSLRFKSQTKYYSAQPF